MERFLIKEGLYDPGIFKAFFLAGGPGSGKTFVTKKITGGLGLKNVNSDTAFEVALKKAGLSLDMPASQEKERDEIRARSKRLTAKRLDLYIMGRLGLVIDSTARDTKKIEIGLSALKRLGYDCYMIFVNTSLDVALARNAKRDRKVPRDITIKSHKQIQANMGYLQRIFGMKNFIVIDNNKFNDDILEKSYKMVRKIVKKPIQNYTAKMWLKKELEKRQIKEDINIPIKVGDVVKGGKFKNKSITVKKIGKNDKGDITINDKPLLKVRIPSFKEFAEKAPNTADAMKRYRAGKAGFTDKAHLKAKGLIPRADGTKRKSDKYK
jgi:cytidylate kinase